MTTGGEITLSYHRGCGQVVLAFGPMEPGDVVRLIGHIAEDRDGFTERVLDTLAEAMSEASDA